MDTHQHTYNNQNFSCHDLSGLTFTDCTFIRCDFRRTKLRETSFINCKFTEQGDIEGCHFGSADLRDASFKQCHLAMANFTYANCYGIEFRECDLKGADFLRASFANQVSNRMYFCSAYITACNLSYANFEGACLEKCELFENRWIGANLQGASLKESDLSRGVFSADAWGQFSFQGANLCHAELEGLNPRRVDMSGVKIAAWQQEQILETLGIVVFPD
ncbi:Qnr family pentapeptide repeat protein [Enterovibrio nigricans]|uniref:Fluoroquinolone resistance protein n=1 Tax=Enterovibrio nigricans DSM 22720 TaxID=1121868 RepID=A0A1T4VFS9_9GAMM|nr:Qnr family pentapeptide repeat protein [Enterovibrio nigricans]SKA63812.1 fluoroquinolone resistance protein [Enterovibrio nigricans DSM 22720]